MRISLPRLDAKALGDIPGWGGQLIAALNGHFGQLDAALAGQLGLENLRMELVETTAKMAEPTWTAATLAANWSNLAGWYPARYRMHPGGTVEVTANISKSVALAPPDTIFTLPIGYRPAASLTSHAAGELAQTNINIDTGGNFLAYAGTAGGPGTFLVTSRVFFEAASPAAVLPLTGADWPLRMKTSLPSRIVGAWLAQAQDSESGASISVGPGGIDWEQDGDGRLVVRNVAGLQPGRTYRLRFLAMGG